MAMLEIEGVNTFRGAAHVLNGVSLNVGQEEVVCLVGHNGAGKTMTIESINGLLPVRSGTIRFRGEEITRLPAPREAAIDDGGARMVLPVTPKGSSKPDGINVIGPDDAVSGDRESGGLRHFVIQPIVDISDRSLKTRQRNRWVEVQGFSELVENSDPPADRTHQPTSRHHQGAGRRRSRQYGVANAPMTIFLMTQPPRPALRPGVPQPLM